MAKPKFLSLDGVRALVTYMKEKLATKVDKEPGKSLSDNNYSDADVAKLESIESGAQENLIESISINSVAQAINDKNVNIAIPLVDATLKNAGQSADAKATGDAIAEVNQSLSQTATAIRQEFDDADNQLAEEMTQALEELSGTIPTKTSDLTNDSDYTTKGYVDDEISGVESAIPTKTSELTNDSDYTTKQYVDGELDTLEASIPTKVSQLQNDSSYATTTQLTDGLATKEDTLQYGTATATDVGKAMMPKTVESGKVTSWEFGEAGKVDDVQVNGTSILENKVANIPIAGTDKLGVVLANPIYGISVSGFNGDTYINKADLKLIKEGSNIYRPIVPYNQHESAFYGLAKAAGDATQLSSSNAVGAYTDEAKTAIQSMLGVNEFDFSDRIAKGVDDNGDIVNGAIIEGTLSEPGKNKASGFNSHAEGYNTTASGNYSHAEGGNTIASNLQSHAEGGGTIASGSLSHAEGQGTIASGDTSHAEGYGGTFTINNVSYTSEAKGIADHTEGYQTRTTSGQPGNHAEGYQTAAIGGASHAEGNVTTASGQNSHAEGASTTASGYYSHAEGSNTTASGSSSHVEGASTIASGVQSHAEGTGTTASGSSSHAEGNSIIAAGASSHAEGGSNSFSSKIINNVTYTQAGAYGQRSHSEGQNTLAIGNVSHAEGSGTVASGNQSHAEGSGTVASGLTSHAEGAGAKATGNYSHAEGCDTTASGLQSHTEGVNTIASGVYSHAEGCGGTFTINGISYTSEAKGIADHTEGFQTRTAADGIPGNHAEGYQTAATGGTSHAEGSNTTASGVQSHAEGYSTLASGVQSHAEGYSTLASGVQSHAEGSNTTASGTQSHAEGYSTLASGVQSHASGSHTIASGNGSYTEGNYNDLLSPPSIKVTGSKNTLVYTYDEMISPAIEKNKKYFINNKLITITELDTVNKTMTIDKTLNENNNWTNQQVTVIKPVIASGLNSHAEGQYTTASGSNSHAEGYSTTASGNSSHAEGFSTDNFSRTVNNVTYTHAGAYGKYSHSEGYNTLAVGDESHAEGQSTTASGDYSHVEGNSTTASGNTSHAEGTGTTASGNTSHAEGTGTTASGSSSHAEGSATTASNYQSHAEGSSTTASGASSHAEGSNTIANHKSQHVFGEFNIADDSSTATADKRGNYVEIVGNGTRSNARSNARTLDWNGNEVLAGKLTVGVNPTNTMDVSTKGYVDTAVSQCMSVADIDATLSTAGKTADAKAVGDEISELKADLDENVNDSRSALSEIGTKTINLFDKNASGIKDGYTMYTNGSEAPNADYFISNFIDVYNVDTLYLYPVQSRYLRIVFYNTKNSADIESIASPSNNIIQNTNNAPYMRFAAPLTNKNELCVSSTYTSVYVPYGYKKAALKEIVDLLEVRVANNTGDIENIYGIVGDGIDEQSIGAQKALSTYTSVAVGDNVRFTIQKKSTVRGILKQIKLKAQTSGSGTVYLGTYIDNVYSYITKFTVNVAAGENTLINGTDFTYTEELPIGTVIGWLAGPRMYYSQNDETSLIITVNLAERSSQLINTEQSYGVSISAVIGYESLNEIEKANARIDEIILPQTQYAKKELASFTNSTLKLDEVTAIKKKLDLSFFGTITAFNDLEIGYAYFGNSTTYYDRITISDTTVTVANKDNLTVHSYEHGLTVQNNIAVLIEMKLDETADITLMSDGETWTQNVSWFRMISIVSPYVKVSSSTTLTDCKLTMICGDYNQRIFAYGDSYFNYSQARWIYYAAQEGFTNNMLLDAYPGEYSTAAFKCFKEDIKHGKPKYVLWCLGMNDGSDSEIAPATAWKNTVESVIAYCKEIGAVPILATIPTVATNDTVTRNNEQKNAWVRDESNCRYIDFAKAVGAGADGVWYDGMLEPTGDGINERVHPTAKGAKALFMQACVDFPEMMLSN